MKKILSIFMLLVAVTTGAWAETTTIYERGVSTAWSSSDVTKTANTQGQWYNSAGIVTNSVLTGMMIDATYGLRLAARNTTATAVLTLNRTANTVITLDAVWNVGSASADGNTPHNQFSYGDLMIQQNVRSNNLTTTYRINGKTVTASTNAFARQDDMTIHLVVNSIDGNISEFYLKNGETTVVSFSDLETNKMTTFASGSNYDAITMLSWISASSSYAWCGLKSITVKQTTQDVETANVTFKYEDTEGNSLSTYKADQVASDVALGTEISTLIPSYNATFYNGEDDKYVYSSYVVTGDYTTVQKGGNTVTLKFTDYPATAYIVKAQASGADLTTFASGTAFLDGSTTKYWSKYINVDDKWYVADEATYGRAITSATNNVAYTATDVLDYFFEAESMTLSREYASISNDLGYSNAGGKGVYASAYLTSTSTIPEGIYTITIGSIARNVGRGQTYKISYSTDGETFTETGKSISFTTIAGFSEQSVTVSIPEEAYIRLTEGNGGNANDYVDYVLIKKLPDFVSGTLPESGIGTLASAYPLDLSGVEAYVISEIDEDGRAICAPITEAPAGTGIILVGEENEAYSIPVVASATLSVNNLLEAAVTATPIEANEAYIVQGGEFHLVTAASTVPAGKAYLPASVKTTAKAISLSFGEITGISEAEAAKATVAAEGKFIENGKLVIVKNGQKFNAAGALLK